MKTQVLLFALFCSVFAIQVQGQSRTYVNATNSEISDNLDLRVVASIFGDSKNLNDFERRLNDPKLQISNLDLNNDYQVDYLRVIESVEKNTHVVIIQSVLDRDIYQDVATIEVEKDRYNKVQIQVIGNTYLYGHNYIYEPIYYKTPYIYASFWAPYYRPYISTWCWNYYPSYYYAWNPYPVYRYRYNINNCINTYNNYNYVNYRRSNIAVGIYNSKRSNGYEKLHPEHAFSRRNSEVNNRYEYDQKRYTRNNVTNISVGYSTKSNKYPSISNSQRIETMNSNAQNRTDSRREYPQNKVESIKESYPQKSYSQRNYSQTISEKTNRNSSQNNEYSRENNQSRNSYSTENNSSSRRSNNRS